MRDKQEAETKRQALIEQLRDVRAQREQIVELGEGGICPICARPLGTHFRSVLDVLDKQIETITVDGKYFRARIEQLAAMPPEVTTLDERRRELTDAVDQARATSRRGAGGGAGAGHDPGAIWSRRTNDTRRSLVSWRGLAVNYDAARHGEVRALVDRLAPLAARATKLAAQLEREPVLVEERTTVRAKADEVQRRRADVARQTQALGFSEDAFDALRGTFDSAEVELRTAELAAVGAETELAAAKAALATAEQARAELARGEERLAVLGRDRRLHDELDRAFSDLRTELNQWPCARKSPISPAGTSAS